MTAYLTVTELDGTPKEAPAFLGLKSFGLSFTVPDNVLQALLETSQLEQFRATGRVHVSHESADGSGQEVWAFTSLHPVDIAAAAPPVAASEVEVAAEVAPTPEEEPEVPTPTGGGTQADGEPDPAVPPAADGSTTPDAPPDPGDGEHIDPDVQVDTPGLAPDAGQEEASA